MGHRFIVLMIFLFGWAGLLAQTPQEPAKVWTLQECVEYALSNSLSVQRSILSEEGSEINLKQSQLSLFPSLSANGNYGSRWGRSIDPTSNAFITRQYNSSGVSGNSSVLLWNSFRLQNNIKGDRLDVEASLRDLDEAKNSAALNVATFYLQVLLNKEQLNNTKSLFASSEQQLERTRIMVNSGALANSELLNIEAQYATNELNVIQAQNALDLSLLSLKQALQLPASTPFDIVAPDIDMQNEVLDQQSPEDIYSNALEAMPEIEGAHLREHSSAVAVKSAMASMHPSLSMSGGINSNYSAAANLPRFTRDGGTTVDSRQIGYVQGSNELVFSDVPVPTGTYTDGYGFSDQLHDNVSKSLSISLNIPIFNGLSARSSMQRATIANKQAKINETETRNQLRQQIETAYTNALAASKTYQAALKQVQARDEAFRMISQRYDIGASTFLEYEVSQNDLFQAQSSLTRAKFDFVFRKKVIDFYQGKPITL